MFSFGIFGFGVLRVWVAGFGILGFRDSTFFFFSLFFRYVILAFKDFLGVWDFRAFGFFRFWIFLV